jgi:CubicO group peptidase (beta-lactamase class C family)
MALVALTAATLPTAAAVAQAPDPGTAVDQYVSALALDTQFSGTVLVARGADIVLEKSYGKVDSRAPTANTPATLFAVASLTKPMTGIAARALAERGALGLEDSIAKWLPDFPNGTRITVAQLLRHRSGIPHRVTQLSDEQKSQTAESMTELASRAPRSFEPNRQRLYSSAGYSVLARVLELSSGKPYSQLLREIVLVPAGALDAADATERAELAKQRALGHFWTHAGPIAAPAKDLSFLVGAGSLWTTARDLYKVSRRLTDGGYGDAGVGARAQNGSITWTGFTNGFFASVDYDPATDVTLVITSNLLTGAADWIRRDVPRMLAGQVCATPRAPSLAVVELSQDRRQQLRGLYIYNGTHHELTFLNPTTALLGGEYLLIAISDTSFFAPQNYVEFKVLTDSVGIVSLSGENDFSITRAR